MHIKPKNTRTENRMLAFAIGGEQTVARIRLALVAGLFAWPVFQLVLYRTINPDLLIGFSAVGVVAIVFYLLARHSRFHPWLSYVTSVSDVTLVSAVLVTFMRFSNPLVAADSRGLWALYLLAIGISALRPRLAIGEYFAIALYADLRWNLADSTFVAAGYNYFDWFSQAGRIILMGATGILTTVLVKRISYISRLAGTDSLTGIFNRTYFNRRYSAPAVIVTPCPWQ